MTLEQLRIFVAVAEREHVTQAARDLNLTQSAVSAAVTALEERHETQLFDRIGRRIALTQAGRLFLTEARAVLARAAAAETVLADLAGLKRGSLSLAASQTVGNYWLPPLMARFRHDYPGIALSLTIGNTETVAAMVRESLVDVGFVEGDVDEPLLTITPVAEDELVLVVSAAQMSPRKAAALRPADLKSMPWVFRERGSGTRALFEQALKKHGIAASDLNVVLELPSNEAVRRAVEAGAGATVLSRMAVETGVASGALTMLNFTVPPRRFLALHHKERQPTQAERALFALAGAGTPPLTAPKKPRRIRPA